MTEEFLFRCACASAAVAGLVLTVHRWKKQARTYARQVKPPLQNPPLITSTSVSREQKELPKQTLGKVFVTIIFTTPKNIPVKPPPSPDYKTLFTKDVQLSRHMATDVELHA